jgi:altronate dehydratase
MTLYGYPRPHGRWGARNHVFVLPSVVCSGLAAERIAELTGSIAVVHQHGCAHVGDDVEHTERAFLGMACNPNVGGTVVVSLGCETIQGRRVANRIAERGQRLEFTGIQLSGGTQNTIELGRAAVLRLQAQVAGEARVEMPSSGLLAGIEGGTPEVRDRLLALLVEAGAGVVLAGARPPAPQHATALAYGDPAPAGRLSFIEEPGEGAEQHVALAAAGAQVLVSLRSPGQAPVGFAICPVIAVAARLYSALADDFDVDGSGDPDAVATEIFDRVIAVFNGEPSASERRGARDFALGRVARTM